MKKLTQTHSLFFAVAWKKVSLRTIRRGGWRINYFGASQNRSSNKLTSSSTVVVRSRAELNDVQARIVCLGCFWRQIHAICGSDISNTLHDIETALGELRLDVAVGIFVIRMSYVCLTQYSCSRVAKKADISVGVVDANIYRA